MSLWSFNLIYLATFLLSCVIAYVAEKQSASRKWVLVFVAFLPLVLLAGLRDSAIGVDTDYYPLPYFHYSMNMNILDMMKEAGCEPGFSALFWAISRITRSFNAVLTVIQLLMVLPLVWTLYKLKINSIIPAVLVYACTFFPWSLNIMRQSLAASILLISFVLAFEGKPRWYLVSSLICVSVHLTGILSFAIWPVFQWSKLDDTKRNRAGLVIVFTVLFAIGFSLVFGEQLLGALSHLKESYKVQLEEMGTGDINVFVTVFPVLCSLLMILSSTRNSEVEIFDQKVISALILISAVAAELSLLSILSMSLARIGQMCLIFCPIIASVANDVLNGFNRGKLFVWLVMAFSLLLFLWVYCYGDAAGIIPYRMANPLL